MYGASSAASASGGDLPGASAPTAGRRQADSRRRRLRLGRRHGRGHHPQWPGRPGAVARHHSLVKSGVGIGPVAAAWAAEAVVVGTRGPPKRKVPVTGLTSWLWGVSQDAPVPVAEPGRLLWDVRREDGLLARAFTGCGSVAGVSPPRCTLMAVDERARRCPTFPGDRLAVGGSEGDGVQVVLDVDGSRSSAVALSKSPTSSSTPKVPRGPSRWRDCAPARPLRVERIAAWGPLTAEVAGGSGHRGAHGYGMAEANFLWGRTGSVTIRVIGV